MSSAALPSATAAPVTVTLLFDGTCGFCTRSVRLLKQRDKRSQITAIPCQIAVNDPTYGLSLEDCSKSVWAYASDGRQAAGDQAFTLILSIIWSNTWPERLGRLPGVRHVLDFGYKVIARNRYRFPGDTPACQSGEFDCGDVAGTSCRMPF